MAVEPAVRRPALVGEVDGVPVAAISLADGRVVADPYHPVPGSSTSSGSTAPAGAPAAAAMRCVATCALHFRSCFDALALVWASRPE